MSGGLFKHAPQFLKRRPQRLRWGCCQGRVSAPAFLIVCWGRCQGRVPPGLRGAFTSTHRSSWNSAPSGSYSMLGLLPRAGQRPSGSYSMLGSLPRAGAAGRSGRGERGGEVGLALTLCRCIARVCGLHRHAHGGSGVSTRDERGGFVVRRPVVRLPCMPVRPLWGGLKRRAVRRVGEITSDPYAELVSMPQCMPVRPLWGGLTRRAMRRLEEHAKSVRRASEHAAAHAGAPLAGRLEEARDAPFRRARVIRTPCW